MKIVKSKCNFEREPLVAPFGFKGSYLSELWQSIVLLESNTGHRGIGLGTQSVLWSDADVFTSCSEADGNRKMFLVTSYAAKMTQELSWENPIDLLNQLLPLTFEYAKKVTANNQLHLTFALNALVAVDNAAWLLYCRENGITSFSDMIPKDIKPALSCRHKRVAGILLITYGLSMDRIVEAVNDGYCILKIKIGSDPDKDGDLDKMLEWDKQRFTNIHQAVKDNKTPYTENGHIFYYLDANGRYDTKDRLMQLLEHARRIGALDRIIITEEPFPQQYKVDVSDIGVCIAADESAHSDKDAAERIGLGYTAIALKPVAKTMSMSLKVAKIAHDKNIPCFCADLTVNPILVDWNKNVAARLGTLPGMKVGVLESNGHQNYRNWEAMKSYHPCNGSAWMETHKGMLSLDEDFYARSGGIFNVSKHYEQLV